MNQTSEDDRFYKEPEPLTKAQEEQLLQIEEDVKRKMAGRDVLEVLWMEKYYSDKTNRDLF